jgi:hypothetical protein
MGSTSLQSHKLKLNQCTMYIHIYQIHYNGLTDLTIVSAFSKWIQSFFFFFWAGHQKLCIIALGFFIRGHGLS